ncbi:hypothetical protein ACLI4R_10735 [Natrialbaceae archaeon A-chndr2]
MNEDEIDLDDIQTISNQLSERDLEVLRLTSDYEPTRASTIREAVYWAERNQDIHYRWSKLADHGLITREEVESTDYPIPPKEAWITPRGQNVAVHAERTDQKSLEERVEKIEKQLGAMRQTYGQVKGRIVALEDEIETHDGDLDDIATSVRRIRHSLDEDQVEPNGFQF